MAAAAAVAVAPSLSPLASHFASRFGGDISQALLAAAFNSCPSLFEKRTTYILQEVSKAVNEATLPFLVHEKPKYQENAWPMFHDYSSRLYFATVRQASVWRVKALLDAGVNKKEFDQYNPEGFMMFQSICMNAVSEKKVAIALLIISYYHNLTSEKALRAMNLAISSGSDKRVVLALLEFCKAELAEIKTEQITPLYWACDKVRPDLIPALLSVAPNHVTLRNPYVRGNNGFETALEIAKTRKMPVEIIEMLEKAVGV